MGADRYIAAMSLPGTEPTPAERQWFHDHYQVAPSEMADFIQTAGVELEGKSIADIGCGDGIMDLGFFNQVKPSQLVGFDLNPVDRGALLARAQANGVEIDAIPDALEYRVSGPVELPAETHSFDRVVTWSAFEHVGDPLRLFKEIRRIMKPDGVLFLQLWPFYHSHQGGHLWDWFPEGFAHLTKTEDEIVAAMRADDKGNPGFTEYMIDEIRHLNRATVDDLQRSMLAAGLFVTKFQLLTEPVHIKPELSRYPLSQLGIGGVKLLAVVA